jgi:hypothetical protein
MVVGPTPRWLFGSKVGAWLLVLSAIPCTLPLLPAPLPAPLAFHPAAVHQEERGCLCDAPGAAICGWGHAGGGTEGGRAPSVVSSSACIQACWCSRSKTAGAVLVGWQCRLKCQACCLAAPALPATVHPCLQPGAGAYNVPSCIGVQGNPAAAVRLDQARAELFRLSLDCCALLLQPRDGKPLAQHSHSCSSAAVKRCPAAP